MENLEFKWIFGLGFLDFKMRVLIGSESYKNYFNGGVSYQLTDVGKGGGGDLWIC
jgi:hypothetical protein